MNASGQGGGPGRLTWEMSPWMELTLLHHIEKRSEARGQSADATEREITNYLEGAIRCFMFIAASVAMSTDDFDKKMTILHKTLEDLAKKLGEST